VVLASMEYCVGQQGHRRSHTSADSPRKALGVARNIAPELPLLLNGQGAQLCRPNRDCGF